MMDQGMIRETPLDLATEKVARGIVEARALGREVSCHKFQHPGKL
jgi:hypothetical protein